MPRQKAPRRIPSHVTADDLAERERQVSTGPSRKERELIDSVKPRKLRVVAGSAEAVALGIK